MSTVPHADASTPTVTAVIVAFGAEPWLEDSVHACLGSEGERVEVVLVDNGCTDGAVDRLDGVRGVTVVRPGENTGFAGGCVLGAAKADGEVLAFVNPDAIVDPACLAALAAEARQPGTGIATASVRLADAPDRLNSGGNEIHALGLSWAGCFNEPADHHPDRREVLAASGACMAMVRERYQRLGGFCETYFAYQEDAELSVRSWLAGWAVVYVPGAVVRHRYHFSRNAEKFYLLDRNRLILVLTTYHRTMLWVLAPLLLAQELAMCVLAVAQGWWPQRRRSLMWLLANRRWLRERRQEVRAGIVSPAAEATMLDRFSMAIRPANMEVPAAAALATPVVTWWWRAARALAGLRGGDR